MKGYIALMQFKQILKFPPRKCYLELRYLLDTSTCIFKQIEGSISNIYIGRKEVKVCLYQKYAVKIHVVRPISVATSLKVKM